MTEDLNNSGAWIILSSCVLIMVLPMLLIWAAIMAGLAMVKQFASSTTAVLEKEVQTSSEELDPKIEQTTIALQQLGYTKAQAKKAVVLAYNQTGSNPKIETLIKASLKILTEGRVS